MQKPPVVRNERDKPLVYRLGSGASAHAAWIDTSAAHPGCEPVDCRVCGNQWVRFVSPRAKKIGLAVSKPGKLDDVKSLSFGMYLCSQAFEGVWKRSRLTGIRFLVPCEVELINTGPRFEEARKAILLGQYKIFVASGSGGSSISVNKRRLQASCRDCGFRSFSTVKNGKWKISRQKWDGSDCFRFIEDGPVMFTQRAADAFAKESLAALSFEIAGKFV